MLVMYRQTTLKEKINRILPQPFLYQVVCMTKLCVLTKYCVITLVCIKIYRLNE